MHIIHTEVGCTVYLIRVLPTTKITFESSAYINADIRYCNSS